MSYCALQTPTMSFGTPLIELRHTPTNELSRHKPQQWATPHPSNELRHISRMSFITPLQWATKNLNIEIRHTPYNELLVLY